MLVAHERREIEIRRREPDGTWSSSVTGEGGTAHLTSIDSTLSVDDVYRDPLA